MNQANVFLTREDDFYLYDFSVKQLYSKIDAVQIQHLSSARFPNLSPKDKRLLIQGTNVILPRSNKIIIELDRIPIIIVRMRDSSGLEDGMFAYIFVSAEYTPQSLRFVENFEKLLLDISETEPVSEFSILEVLLTFISQQLNEQYSRILLEYSEFNYFVHAETNEELSLMQTQCSHLLDLLDDLLGNESQMALLLFLNQDALEEEVASVSVSSKNGSVASHLERLGSVSKLGQSGSATATGQLNMIGGMGTSFGPHLAVNEAQNQTKAGSRSQSSDNLKALSQQQIKNAHNIDDVEEALDSYQTQFRTISNEIAEMQSKMELYLEEAQIQYDMERNYIVEFALKQKIMNVALTATSLIGALFGENMVFRFGFDNEEWTSISPVPFVCMMAASICVFCVALGTIMFNYRKRSLLDTKRIPTAKNWLRRSKKDGYSSISAIALEQGVEDVPL